MLEHTVSILCRVITWKPPQTRILNPRNLDSNGVCRPLLTCWPTLFSLLTCWPTLVRRAVNTCAVRPSVRLDLLSTTANNSLLTKPQRQQEGLGDARLPNAWDASMSLQHVTHERVQSTTLSINKDVHRSPTEWAHVFVHTFRITKFEGVKSSNTENEMVLQTTWPSKQCKCNKCTVTIAADHTSF